MYGIAEVERKLNDLSERREHIKAVTSAWVIWDPAREGQQTVRWAV